VHVCGEDDIRGGSGGGGGGGDGGGSGGGGGDGGGSGGDGGVRSSGVQLHVHGLGKSNLQTEKFDKQKTVKLCDIHSLLNTEQSGTSCELHHTKLYTNVQSGS